MANDFAADPGSEMRSNQAAVADPPDEFASRRPLPNPLFPEGELRNLRSCWDRVQTSFVDEPRSAVKQADSLVADMVARIAEQSRSEREQLEKQWNRGEDVNTEDLRQALRRYRAFFDRLLSF